MDQSRGVRQETSQQVPEDTNLSWSTSTEEIHYSVALTGMTGVREELGITATSHSGRGVN
jgi:hypothetical protein